MGTRPWKNSPEPAFSYDVSVGVTPQIMSYEVHTKGQHPNALWQVVARTPVKQRAEHRQAA